MWTFPWGLCGKIMIGRRIESSMMTGEGIILILQDVRQVKLDFNYFKRNKEKGKREREALNFWTFQEFVQLISYKANAAKYWKEKEEVTNRYCCWKRRQAWCLLFCWRSLGTIWKMSNRGQAEEIEEISESGGTRIPQRTITFLEK